MDPLPKSIGSLTLAVWCLVAVNFIQLALWFIPYIAPTLFVSRMAATSGEPAELFESWEGLSFDEKVKRSSIVLVTENRLSDGGIRAYIKEELKRTPGTKFHYKIGDEYLPLAIVPRENTHYGDGSLVLFQGSPAKNRESYSIFNGSAGALGDMPLTKVREIVASNK